MSQTLQNQALYAKSMNGIITLSDGTLTIENGAINNASTIETDSINTASFSTNDFVVNTNVDLTGDTSKIQFLYGGDPNNTVISRTTIDTPTVYADNIYTTTINGSSYPPPAPSLSNVMNVGNSVGLNDLDMNNQIISNVYQIANPTTPLYIATTKLLTFQGLEGIALSGKLTTDIDLSGNDLLNVNNINLTNINGVPYTGGTTPNIDCSSITINNNTVGSSVFTMNTTEDSATPIKIHANRMSSSPAVNDRLLDISAYGKDSSNYNTQYATMRYEILNPTNGSTQGRIAFETMKAGNYSDRFTIDNAEVRVTNGVDDFVVGSIAMTVQGAKITQQSIPTGLKNEFKASDFTQLFIGGVEITAGAMQVETLDQVLASGNSCGNYNINMNNKQILNCNNINTTNINGATFNVSPTLTQIMSNGNSVGTYDLDMNNKQILNCANINTTNINGSTFNASPTLLNILNNSGGKANTSIDMSSNDITNANEIGCNNITCTTVNSNFPAYKNVANTFSSTNQFNGAVTINSSTSCRAINQQADFNISQSGTGILSQTGTGTNTMKAITSTGDIQTTGKIYNTLFGTNNVSYGNTPFAQTSGYNIANNCVAIGQNALQNGTNCSYSVAIGYNTLKTTTYGSHIGIGSLTFQNIAYPSDYNVGVGAFVASALQNGSNNVGFGQGALYALKGDVGGCNSNIAIGRSTLYGGNSVFLSATANNNSAIGAYALFQPANTATNTGLKYNTAIGTHALSANPTLTEINDTTGYWMGGISNSALGYGAGCRLTSQINASYVASTPSNYNTFVGSLSNVENLNTSYNYSTAIGYNAIIKNSNEVVIGGDNGSGVFAKFRLPNKNTVYDNQNISANTTLTFDSGENVIITSNTVNAITLPTVSLSSSIGATFTISKSYTGTFTSITITAGTSQNILDGAGTSANTYSFGTSQSFIKLVCIATTGDCWSIVSKSGGGSGGSQTLSDVLTTGNSAGGNDILNVDQMTFVKTSVGSANPAITITTTDDTATGEFMLVKRMSASPATGDVLFVEQVNGNDNTALEKTYTQIEHSIANPSSSALSGMVSINCANGTNAIENCTSAEFTFNYARVYGGFIPAYNPVAITGATLLTQKAFGTTTIFISSTATATITLPAVVNGATMRIMNRASHYMLLSHTSNIGGSYGSGTTTQEICLGQTYDFLGYSGVWWCVAVIGLPYSYVGYNNAVQTLTTAGTNYTALYPYMGTNPDAGGSAWAIQTWNGARLSYSAGVFTNNTTFAMLINVQVQTTVPSSANAKFVGIQKNATRQNSITTWKQLIGGTTLILNNETFYLNHTESFQVLFQTNVNGTSFGSATSNQNNRIIITRVG